MPERGEELEFSKGVWRIPDVKFPDLEQMLQNFYEDYSSCGCFEERRDTLYHHSEEIKDVLLKALEEKKQ